MTASQTSVQNASLGEMLGTVGREAWRQRVLIAIGFAIIALLVLVIGLLLPKKYVSETTILTLEQNIVKELTAGVAVPTSLNDRAAMIRDVIFSRKIMLQILDDGGWMARKPTLVEQERYMNEIAGRTSISGGKENLIRLSYHDHDPQRAYTVVTRMAELFMGEVRDGKSRESRDAFRFIDNQVQAYQQKLSEVEKRMAAYREKHPDFVVNGDKEANERLTELRRTVESSKLELAQQLSIETTLASQLAGTSATQSSGTKLIRGAAADPRVADLQKQLNAALTSYTEQHPDVVRLRAQLAEARSQSTGVDAVYGSTSQSNPVYSQLRTRLSEVRSQIAGLRSRIDAGTAMTQTEFQRGRPASNGDQDGMELSSDYQVYRDLYQKLLSRRETARVSMNLDEEQSGIGFRIQEPAVFPLESVGLRFMHFAIGGLMLALLLPLAVVAGISQLDGKLRSAAAMERALALPVMATVPVYRTAQDRGIERSRTTVLVTVVIGVLAIYAILYAMRQWGAM